jgi:hypothetical protein
MIVSFVKKKITYFRRTGPLPGSYSVILISFLSFPLMLQ